MNNALIKWHAARWTLNYKRSLLRNSTNFITNRIGTFQKDRCQRGFQCSLILQTSAREKFASRKRQMWLRTKKWKRDFCDFFLGVSDLHFPMWERRSTASMHGRPVAHGTQFIISIQRTRQLSAPWARERLKSNRKFYTPSSKDSVSRTSALSRVALW